MSECPTVKVILREHPTRIVFLWEVTSCPFCGQKHTHGAGKNRKTVEQYLSRRVSHCVPGGSYSLQWNGEVR